MAEYVPHVRFEKRYKTRVSPFTDDFKALYRFHEDNLQWIANHFLGENSETRGGALSSEHRMKIFLRYVADPGFQSGIGEEVGVHQTTVSRTVAMVMEKIIAKAHMWIKFPSSQNAIDEAKQLWQTEFSFPSAIGVVDCTHIKILKPAVHGDEYINRKGYSSLNVQATCDAREVFTSVDVSWPGSVHDSRIWKNSDARTSLRQFNDAVLLGDDGYGIEPWLMTPYRNPVEPMQRAYNRLFKRERVIIERCFGQLKRRFPILQYTCRVLSQKIPSIIICCFVLHNVAKYLQDDDFVGNENGEEGVNIEDAPIDEGELRQRGCQKRSSIARIIHNQEQA